MYSKKSNPIRFAKMGEHVEIGQHLSPTPSQVAEMSEHGIPISTSNMESNFFDGSEDYSFHDFDATDVRGVDISDIWNAEQDARSKVKKLSKLRLKAQNLEKTMLVGNSGDA